MRLPRTLCLAFTGLFLLAAVIAGCGSSSSSSSSTSEGTAAAATESEGGGDPVKVGILQIADIEVLDQTVAAFEAGMKKSLAPREVEFELKDAQEETSLIAARAIFSPSTVTVSMRSGATLIVLAVTPTSVSPLDWAPAGTPASAVPIITRTATAP